MKIRRDFEISGSRRIAFILQIGEISSLRVFAKAHRSFILAEIFGLSVAICLALSGCGSSSVKPSVGAITVTNANGVAQSAVTKLTVGGGMYLDVTLTNDKNLLGADWTVSCGSALAQGTPLPAGETVDTSCGYFTPIHTASAPVPSYEDTADGIVTYYTAPSAPPKAGTVTLYASASEDHSRFSSLTLTIAGEPITIAIVASTAPPFTLAPGSAMTFYATLSNDYTVGGGSVSWSLSCGSSDCGSLSATRTSSGTAVTYTAPSAIPSGNTVTVTATSVTDPTESNSVVVTITQ